MRGQERRDYAINKDKTHFPHSPQKHLSTHFPLPVAISLYFFITPFSSCTFTLSFSIARFEDTYDPATFRQLEQWHKWPRGRVKSSESVMVTRMEPQRQVLLREVEKEEGGWEFGLPVRVWPDMVGYGKEEAGYVWCWVGWWWKQYQMKDASSSIRVEVQSKSVWKRDVMYDRPRK